VSNCVIVIDYRWVHRCMKVILSIKCEIRNQEVELNIQWIRILPIHQNK